MTWVAIGVGVASIAVGQIIRIATAPSQLKTQADVIGDQSDTGVSSGRYGDPIALLFGSGRLPCQLIWSKEIREQVNVTSETVTQSGGKGGGGGASTTTTTTTYTYYGTFAVEICSNEIIGVSKIWLNSKVFYENRPFLLGTPLAASQESQQFFTVYNGRADQIQDPTIVAAMSAARTPAYRNRAIIVFKELLLTEFGNRLPVVEVLAHQDGSGNNLGTIAPMPTKLHGVVSKLCKQAGLTDADVDLTELTDDVEGYSASQRGNVQGFLRELAQVYHFGCVDTGKVLKFISHPVPVLRDEYRNPCMINEDFLIANSYHEVLGRSGYFPGSCGTSEGQFAQIIACMRAYQATSDVYWRDLGLSMANALPKLYFSEPPANPAVLYTPHWLFNVKKPIQLQSSVLTAKVLMVRQGDGTYQGTIPAGPGFYGDLVTTVTRVYDNTHSYLVWKNPYSGVRGIAYSLPTSTTVTSGGAALTFGVNAFGTVASIVVNCAYIVNAGKMLGVSEMMEAWPHWREIEGGEIDCAVDTLAWALEAFDLLFTVTADTKWQDGYDATASNIASIYAVDDGRWWFKKAKGSPFVLSGTFLVAEAAAFGDSQITRNNELVLNFNVNGEAALSSWAGAASATIISFFQSITRTSQSLYDFEIQFGRGINDVIKVGDTHIKLRASASTTDVVVRVFLQDKDDDLLTATRWFYDLALTTTMTDYSLALGSFKKYTYPFTSANFVSNGISAGQILKVAGIMFYPYKSFSIQMESLRPIPEVVLPYTPNVAPYTANSLGGQILDWQGGPGVGYQNCYAWAKIGNATKLTGQIQFISDSQAAYTALFPGTVGPFAPAYTWDRYDVLEIAGTPGTWTWNWPDPNTEWVGYTARVVEGLGHGAFVASNTTARTLCGNFLTWLNTNWPGGQYIPTNFPQSIPTRANSTSYKLDGLMKPAVANGRVYRANNAGTTAASPPAFPTTIGATVVDGGVTWRCQGYTYGASPVYGEYNEPHAAAMFLRAACWYRLAGGTTALADSVISKCWTYLDSLVVTSGDMAGTWSINTTTKEWYGFWGAEIISTLSLLLTTFNAIRIANSISSTTIQTRIANYRNWLFANTRVINIPAMEDVVSMDDFAVETIQDVELPNEVIIKYNNLKNSGEPEARYSRKQSGYSDASVNLALNMSIPGQDASLLTKVLLNEFWSQKDKYSFDMRSVLVQPMDCLEMTADGKIHRIMVLESVLDTDFNNQISAVSYDQSAYRVSAPSPSDVATSVVTLAYPPQTSVQIFNLPAITDADDVPGYATGASSSSERWIGGYLTASNDGGQTFVAQTSYAVRMTKGVATTVLPANRVFTIDRSIKIVVQLEFGTLETISEAQLLNGQNLALLGEEIINFQSAVLTGVLQYEISGFLRGQKGTEDKIYSHFSGEQFVLLNPAINRVAIDQALINVSRIGRSFTIGRPNEDYTEFNFTATAANLVPWAPVNIKATRATNLDLSWTRRARITNGWNNLNDIPIGETIEQYRVDLLTGPLFPSGTIITSYFTTVPSITISAAQITAAYGSSGATVHVAIRQMSSIVGAGKPLEGSF